MSIIDDVSGGSRERTAFADESFGSFETEAGELVIYDRDDHASFIVSDRWSPVPR